MNKIFIFEILLDQTLDKLQKDLTEEKSDSEEYKGKLELAEKYTTELQTSLDQTKGEIQKLQETVKRYMLFMFCYKKVLLYMHNTYDYNN